MKSAQRDFLAALVLPVNDGTLLDEILPQARVGNKDAQYALGLIYAEGRGVDIDRVASYIWLSRAVAQGDHDADLLRSMVLNEMTDEEFALAKGAL